MPIFPKPIDLAANYVWTGDHTFDGVVICNGDFNAVDGDFTGDINITSDSVINGGNALRLNAPFAIYFQNSGSTIAFLNGSSFYSASQNTTLGSLVKRWGNTYSVDGSFSGSLTSEVGGSYKLYNLGTDGDTDTEYLEIAYTGSGSGSKGIISVGSTGAGADRELILAGNSFRIRGGGGVGDRLYVDANSIIFQIDAKVSNGKHLHPLTDTATNTSTSGLSTKRWANTYSVDGDFSGNITAENLPTSDPGVPGQFYVTTGGALKVSQ